MKNLDMLVGISVTLAYILTGLAFKRHEDRHAPSNEDLTIVWAWPLWLLWYVVEFVKALWKHFVEHLSLPGTRKIKYSTAQGYSFTKCPYEGSLTRKGNCYSADVSRVGAAACQLCIHNRLTTETHVLCSYESDNA
jgi:hypothetical protein